LLFFNEIYILLKWNKGVNNATASYAAQPLIVAAYRYYII